MGRARRRFKGSAVETSRVVADLGALEGEILLFGGPYSNLQALRAVLDLAERRGIPKERRICTGDVVAYCADPVPCWELTRDQCAAIVAGNCEQQIAKGAEACGCGFEEGSVCDLASKSWFPYAARRMEAHRADCAACPDIVTFSQAGRRFAVIHGGVRDVSHFIWSTSPEAVFRSEIDALRAYVGEVDAVIAGHCGIAFARQLGAVHWINAGVIGMPPNDGDPRTEYCILKNGSPQFERLTYPAQLAAEAMAAAGLQQGYDTGVTSGYWPSQSVLPQTLRRRRLAS